MRVLRRRWIWLGLGVSGVSTLGVLCALIFAPADRVVGALRAEAEAAGFELSVTGGAEPVLWPSPGVRLAGFELRDSARQATPVLVADQIILRPSLRTFLRGRWGIGGARLENARLHVQPGWRGHTLAASSPALRLRWPEGGGALTISGPVAVAGDTVDVRLAIRNPVAAVAGHPTAVALRAKWGPDRLSFLGDVAFDPRQRYPVLIGDADLALTDLDGALARHLGMALPPRLQGIGAVEAAARLRTLPGDLLLRIRVSGTLRDHPVTAEAQLAGPAGWADDLDFDAAATLRAGGLFSANAAGVWQDGARFAGTGKLALLDTAATARWLSAPLLATHLPDGAGSLAGDVRIDAAGAEVRSGAMIFGADARPFEASLDLTSARPGLSVTTTLPTLDLAALLQAGPDALRQRWHALDGVLGPDMDLQLDLTVEDLALGEAGTDTADLTLTRGPDRIGLALPHVQAFGGDLEVTLSAAAPDGPISLIGSLAGLDLARVPGQRLSGAVAGGFALTVPSGAQGWSAAAGEVELSVYGGALPLEDLGALAAGQAAVPRTLFVSLDGVFAAEAGTWRTRTLAISGADWRLEGPLTVTMPTGSLDGRLRPVRLPRAEGRLLVLGGTLAEPTVSAEDNPVVAVSDPPPAPATAEAPVAEPTSPPTEPSPPIGQVPIPRAAPR